MGRHSIATVVILTATGAAAGADAAPTGDHSWLAGILMAVAGMLSIGLSGGQTVRCLRRRSSDDVTIVGWLSGAASNGLVLVVVLITHASMWLALWQALGVIEYATPAAIAWWYRSRPETAVALEGSVCSAPAAQQQMHEKDAANQVG